MRLTTMLVAGVLLFAIGSAVGSTNRTQHAPRPLSAADLEHGLKSAVPNARMAALVKKYGVDFELSGAVEAKLRSAGASNDLILQIRHSRSRVVAKPVKPPVHTVVGRPHAPVKPVPALVATSPKELLAQADK